MLIRARIKAALAVKAARGEMCGAPRYGYRLSADGVHVEPDEHEQRVLERIRVSRRAGLSIRAIERELAEDGIVGRRGKPLQRPVLHAIVRRLETASQENTR
jgi:hypothetical protein